MESSVVRSRLLFLVTGADCEFKRKQRPPVCVQRLLYAVALPSTASSRPLSLSPSLSPFSSRRSTGTGTHTGVPVAELLTRSLIRQCFGVRSHGIEKTEAPRDRHRRTSIFLLSPVYNLVIVFFNRPSTTMRGCCTCPSALNTLWVATRVKPCSAEIEKRREDRGWGEIQFFPGLLSLNTRQD